MKTYSFRDPFILEHRCGSRVEAYYSRSWEHYDMPPHFHDRVEIMYVSKGSALIHLYQYQMEGGNRKILITRQRTERLTAGKCMLLDQGVLHRLEVPEEAYMVNLEFILTEDSQALIEFGWLAASSREFSELLKNAREIVIGQDRSGRLLYAMEQTVQELTDRVPLEYALSQVLLSEVLLRFAEAAKDAVLRDNTLSYVRKAATYITSHLDESIRIADIADEVGVASAYLQRIFRQSTGMTIIDYLNRLRVQQSKRLLMFTDDSIMDVAIAAGFNSRQHFFRVFQAETGLSPREFRKAQRGMQAREIFEFDNIQNYWYDDELHQILKDQ